MPGQARQDNIVRGLPTCIAFFSKYDTPFHELNLRQLPGSPLDLAQIAVCLCIVEAGAIP